jgi:phosphatidate phosphatase APP1
LPKYKLRAQSRIYNYIVHRHNRHQERKASGSRIVDIVRKRGRRIFGGQIKNNEPTLSREVTMSGSLSGFGGEGRERGARRKKLAGYLQAAKEIGQSYQQSYQEKWGSSNGDFDDDAASIPGAFPDAAIVSHGDEQLILFPSYAKRHNKEAPNPEAQMAASDNEDAPQDAEYWAREWQKFEDDRAIVDIDVRGWLYSPHRGPMTRKNRLLIGLARQLSGIPAPKPPSRAQSPDSATSLRARHKEHEARREEESIAQEAEQILRKGQGEQQVAAEGGYSERPLYDSDSESIYGERGRSGSHTPSRMDDPPGPGHLHKRASWNQPADMSPKELLAANTHLMARLRPFLTNPLVSSPVTVFFYDEQTSVSRTVMTNEAGHFVMRAALEFVPTHVRVLASEQLSATEEVKVTEPIGVSVISDVDDTIKHSSIGSGAREIFRNAFIRDLGDLTIEGVKEWYNTMYDMGCRVHYVSNSPWQLFPVLASYFSLAGLPPGSYHLKQYSGMLQGIFEPVAERKKGTLEKIMRDFPNRKFILIGDSGEADLEVYTDVVLANPGKVLAIFIRDVTTPESAGYFDSAMGPLSGDRRRDRGPPSRAQSGSSRMTQLSEASDRPEHRPVLPPRAASEVKLQTSAGPTMGKLIDFDDEPEQIDVHESHRRVMPRSSSTFEALDSPRRRSAPDSTGVKMPPPRPSKPLALRGNTNPVSTPPASTNKGSPPPPPQPRRSKPSENTQSHPLSQAQSAADLQSPNQGYVSSARQKVSAAYNSLPEVRSYMPGRTAPPQGAQREASPNNPLDEPPPPPLPRRATGSTVNSITKRLSWNSTDTSEDESYRPSSNTNVPISKKLDMWKRRWHRAKGILEAQGVVLRAWRVGGDVCLEAVQLVEKTLTEMNVEGYGHGKGKTGIGGGEAKVKDLKR